MKLGARILKTGIAIVLALLLAELFNLPTPVFAGIAAIFVIQPTIYRSYLSIIEQVQGNTIGAIIAVLFVLFFGNNIFFIGLAAIIVITINLKLKIEKTIALSLVTLIAIMDASTDSFIQFASIRFLTILLGIFSSFLVNLVFIPPKYENKLYNSITSVSESITKWIRLNIRHASEHKLLKHDIEQLSESIIKIDQLYLMYREERNYFKKSNLIKSRKLVIYRQMIYTLKRAIYTLKKLHRFENEIQSLSEDFQNIIQQQLDCLVHHHEHVMLKFIGKVKPNVTFEEGNIQLNRKELFNLFLKECNEMDQEEASTHYHSMQIVSAIIEYDENVEHLDMLITSFQSHHKTETEVSLQQT
ncbi:aromatic acid exporter family protein [Bacillus sp. 03113]|uniref:FUSC family protein n=1 Tax=Bacillus sp. 03113 TaxID=2578211 RepID=UPI001141AA2C|nr:aromatic acid exporter family protein [Bacillus sp. 03113]